MLSRYRCYSTYSEEDGKLVPSTEPIKVKEVTQQEKEKITKESKENKLHIKEGSRETENK
jgi:hypothetical protein